MTSLTISGLSHFYGKSQSLHQVALQCTAGKITCLLGASGCGKSTLLRCIGGYESPSEGRIVLGDQIVFGDGANIAPEQRQIGMVFQDSALFPHLRVWQNVAFGLRRQPRPQRKALALAALDRFGLADLADRYPHMCSGGQQQRVALARALAVKPQALLLDEPFSGLDACLRESLREDLQRVLAEEALPTVMVTHDPTEALSCGDTIALLRQGRLVQMAGPDTIWSEPVDLEAMAFFSPINVLPVTVESGTCSSPLGNWSCERPAGEWSLALRQQALLPDTQGSITGTVLSQVVQGAYRLVDLRIDDATTLKVRVRNEGPLAETGQWRLDHALTCLFPA